MSVFKRSFSWLQPYKPGELEAARTRVKFKNCHCHAYNVTKKMESPEIGAPSMLIIGASHVTHYKEFVQDPRIEEKCKTLFKNCFFLGVGGTDWESYLDHFEGNA